MVNQRDRLTIYQKILFFNILSGVGGILFYKKPKSEKIIKVEIIFKKHIDIIGGMNLYHL